jgi:hypothetical protein
MFGMCLWSLYDGIVGWPGQNRKMERVRPALLTTNLTAEAWVARDEDGKSPLSAAFSGQGLAAPSKLFRKLDEMKVTASGGDKAALYELQAKRVKKLFEGPVYNAHDLQTQFVQAGVTLCLGALALLSLGLKARRRFFADEAGLHGSGFGGRTLAYGDIARIDWAKWDEKGIVTVTLQSGERHRLDGWHFAGMTGVVDEIRARRPDLCPKQG